MRGRSTSPSGASPGRAARLDPDQPQPRRGGVPHRLLDRGGAGRGDRGRGRGGRRDPPRRGRLARDPAISTVSTACRGSTSTGRQRATPRASTTAPPAPSTRWRARSGTPEPGPIRLPGQRIRDAAMETMADPGGGGSRSPRGLLSVAPVNRRGGIAPAAIFFEAAPTSRSSAHVERADHDPLYKWTFGEERNGTRREFTTITRGSALWSRTTTSPTGQG